MLEHLKSDNFILNTDGYKANHWEELPDDVARQYVVVVPRKASTFSDEIVVAGTAMLASYLASVRITEEMIDEAEREIIEQGYSFNRKGWEKIVRENNGILPIQVFGIEEGTIVKPQTPIVGISATQDGYGWLETYLETITQALIWKMSTVASICRHIRKTLVRYAESTGTTDSVDYMLHNFGDRSADGPYEAPVLAGIAHAMLFNGSDCIRANGFIKKLYNTSKVYMTSIEATEHSVMCAHSDPHAKEDKRAALMAVQRLEACVERAKNGLGLPMMSVVIDTYDDERFVSEYLGTLFKERILKSGGRMIARPDSGDPTTKPGQIGNLLDAKFGSSYNSKGFKSLNPAVGVIQGDGNRIDTFEGVIRGWINAGFCLNNFCLGMGSGITHDGARDDFSFSVKSVATYRHNKWERELKEPKSDLGKASLSGLVRCKENDKRELEVYDALQTGEVFSMFTDAPGWRCYYKDGYRVFRQTFDDVRERARRII